MSIIVIMDPAPYFCHLNGEIGSGFDPRSLSVLFYKLSSLRDIAHTALLSLLDTLD